MADLDDVQEPHNAAIPEPPPAAPVSEVVPLKPDETPAKNPEAKGSPFDCLFVTPEEAGRGGELPKVPVSPDVPPEQGPEEPEEAEVAILAEEVSKICKAIDRLAKKGLNMRAVIALLHDSNPTIPKKHIKTVLEGLRELPAIYGHQSSKG
jgi:hypothetical protein